MWCGDGLISANQSRHIDAQSSKDHGRYLFSSTQRVVNTVRTELPPLDAWLRSNVRILHRLADAIDGHIQVGQYFIANPWPDCYARQVPVAVDTKFIERHAGTLRQWLDLLLPSSAINVNETKFARRFGLRDGQPHRAVRLLDSRMKMELGIPFEELSLPLRSIAALPVVNATIVIVENDLNLLTLPPMVRGIGIRGEGYSVNRMEQLQWLHSNRLLYWGDNDIDGFLILSQLRNLFPHVESVLMNKAAIVDHERFLVDGAGVTPSSPSNLTPIEIEAFEYCSQGNLRLEQEKIPQLYVDEAFLAAQQSGGSVKQDSRRANRG